MDKAHGYKQTAAVSDGSELLTVGEVAAFLRLTPKGIYSLVEGRKIPFVRVSNRLRFLMRDIQNWLQENRVSVIER